MKDLKKIDQSLSETIKNSDLQGLSIDITEAFIDSMLDEGILKDLPIVGSIVGIGKAALNIKDQLFLKKILSFLSRISHIKPERRARMINSISGNSEHKIKVGEKLIYILDRCDDHIDAKYIAQFFCAFLEEKISYQEFLKGSRIIQNIFTGDLEYFLENDSSLFERSASSEEAPHEDEFPLINVGILGFGYNPISVEDQYEPEALNKYIVEGGEAVVWITSIGKKLKEILKIEEL